MQTNSYTKGVLTHFATCLFLLVANTYNLITESSPEPDSVDPKTRTIQNFKLIPVNPNGSIAGRLVSQDELDVNIDEVGGGLISWWLDSGRSGIKGVWQIEDT